MKTLNKKTLLLFLTALGIFAVTVAAFLVLLSQTKKMKASSDALSLQTATDELRNNELEAIRKNIKGTVESREKLLALFLTKESVPDFISSLETMAKNAGLVIKTQSVEVVPDESLPADKESLRIALLTSGGWQGTMQFLQILETLPFDAYVATFQTEFSEEAGTSAGENNVLPPGWQSNIGLTVIKEK